MRCCRKLTVIRTLQALRWSWYDIHIFASRSDEVQDQTLTWLDKFKAPFQLLKMRPAGDRTRDEELKRQWIQGYDLSQILCVFDDRQKVVAPGADGHLLPFCASEGGLNTSG